MSCHIKLLVVGKLKDESFKAIEAEFLKRISSINFQIIELKARSEDPNFEGGQILKKVSEIKQKQKTKTFALSEKGQSLDSINFSEMIFKGFSQCPCLIFIIAGAQGFAPEVLEKVDGSFSLSPLTFPHRFARIIFIEQIYRAITIKEGHPYHN